MTNNYKLLVKVAVFTGMCEGEILGAQWDDIDWKSKQLHVPRSWMEGNFHAPKTATSIRRVDLPDFLVSELRKRRLACPKGPGDFIFPNLEGRPLSHSNLPKTQLLPRSSARKAVPDSLPRPQAYVRLVVDRQR